MRQIRETLRLHLQAGLTYSEVAGALKISKSVVGKYVLLARVAGVDWAVAQTLSDAELEGRLYRPPVPRASDQLAPDFAVIHQELKRAGVTLMLLWEEYASGNAQAYKYTSFCIKYRAWAQTLKRSMRQVHVAGEKLFVDYAPDGHLKLLHLWPPKLLQAGRVDYASAAGLRAMREAASLSL